MGKIVIDRQSGSSAVLHGIPGSCAALVEINIGEGKKADSEKPTMAIIPQIAKEEMAKAFTYGAKKYGAYNWCNGIAVTRLLSAAERHISAFLKGEDVDSESGNLHLGHALASIAMALETAKFKPEFDDRNPMYRGKK